MKAFLVMSACLALTNCEAPLTGYQYTAPAPARLSNYQNNYSGNIAASPFTAPQNYEHYPQPYEPQGLYAQQYHEPGLQLYTQQNTQQYQLPTQDISQYSHQYTQQQQVAQVHKHVYVHVAPEDPEPARVRSLAPVAPPQKHYKIIFVKAPSAPAPAPLVLPQQAPIEEKTIVYLLSKKAEEQEPLKLPIPVATEPSKPEVYFIKYKTRKEQSSISGQAPQLGSVDQSGVGDVEDLESIGVDSARSGQPVPARISAPARISEPAQLRSRYGTPEFQ